MSAVQVLLEAPAIVGEGQRRPVGHGGRRNGVAPAQLRGVHADLGGGDIDQSLDHVGGLGPPGTPIGRGAVRVGQHPRDRHVNRRRGVGAADGADVDHRRHRSAERYEGAEVAEASDPHAQELAVAVERERSVDDIVAGVVVADVGLVAGGEPFDRPADAARGPRHQHQLRIDGAAQPVAAADVAGDQPHLGLGNLQHVLGDGFAKQPWPLEAAMQRVAAGTGVVLSGHTTGFNRIGGDTIDDEPLLDHVRGAGEGGFDRGFVAGFIEIGLVFGAVVVELRRARFERLARRHHRGPHCIVDRNVLGRVAGARRACRQPPRPPDSRCGAPD